MEFCGIIFSKRLSHTKHQVVSSSCQTYYLAARQLFSFVMTEMNIDFISIFYLKNFLYEHEKQFDSSKITVGSVLRGDFFLFSKNRGR